MDELNYIKMFLDYGFPSVLCIFTLVELNKNLKKLSDAINKLTDDVDERLEKLEKEQIELRHRFDLVNR